MIRGLSALFLLWMNRDVAHEPQINILGRAIFQCDMQNPARGHMYPLASSCNAIPRVVIAAIRTARCAGKQGGAGQTNAECSASACVVGGVQDDRLAFCQLDGCDVSPGSAAVALRKMTAFKRARSIACEHLKIQYGAAPGVGADIHSYCQCAWAGGQRIKTFPVGLVQISGYLCRI